MNKRAQISAIYGAGMLQGAAFVLVPSLGKLLAAAPYQYSAQAYGLLYFPEIGGAILGALAAGYLQRRAGSAAVLRAGLAINALGMALLVLASLTHGPTAYAAILVETLCLGLGFGLTLATLNPYAALLFPRTPTTALTVLNGLVGGATALAPLALQVAARVGHWGLLPLVLLLGFLSLLFITPPEHRADASERAHWGMLPFALAVLLYAIAEGSFSSWAQAYVGNAAHASTFTATLALSLFWGGMTALRLLLGLVPEHGNARRGLFVLSALGIGASFAALSQLTGSVALVAGYAVAGAICSIYYPYVMAFGLKAWPQQSVSLAGVLVAALMVGEGTGSTVPGSLLHLLPLSGLYLGLSALALPLAYFAWTLPRRAA
jgi:fucose permease